MKTNSVFHIWFIHLEFSYKLGKFKKKTVKGILKALQCYNVFISRDEACLLSDHFLHQFQIQFNSGI